MHISKEQRCRLNFSVQLILAVSYFADLNPKVPGLILFFLCLCHSKSFFGLFLSAIPCQPGACWLSPCVSGPLAFLHFPLMSLFSVCSLQNEKRTNCTADFRDITLQYTGPYRDPMGVMHSHCILQSSTCCCFTISVSTADVSIQAQMERIRNVRTLYVGIWILLSLPSKIAG